MLEIKIMKLRSFMLLEVILLTLLSICSMNCNKVDVTTPDDITIDTKHVGMVEGRVTSAAIQNNNLVYVGHSGARVEILNTSFTTTSLTNGTYSVDNVPAGSYNIEAVPSSFGSYWSDVVTATVSRQLNPDTGYLNLRRSLVALACQEGVHYECQRKPESGIGGEGYSSEYAAEVFY